MGHMQRAPLGIEVVEAHGSTRALEREGELVCAEALADSALLITYQYCFHIAHLTSWRIIHLINYLIHHNISDLLNQSLSVQKDRLKTVEIALRKGGFHELF